MRIADSRTKAAGFLTAAALAIALAPTQGAYTPAGVAIGDTLQAMDTAITGTPTAVGYTVAMPLAAPAKPAAKARHLRLKD